MSGRICITSIVVLLIIPSVVLGCGFHPNLWCSSPEISEQCGVQKQCMLWQSEQKAADAPLVRYELYFESLCPGCRQLLTTELYPAWQKVKSIVNVTLVPYGNAKELEVAGKWQYTCQHGPQECVGNLVETCALSILPFDKAFPFIYCLETNNPATAGSQCAKELGLLSEYPSIQNCSEGAMGNALEHSMALKTDALNPSHEYVPWVVLNGAHTNAIQNQAESDSLGLICQAYTGVKPAACTQEGLMRSPRD